MLAKVTPSAHHRCSRKPSEVVRRQRSCRRFPWIRTAAGTRDGRSQYTHRTERQTRLVTAIFDQRLVQRLVQEVGLQSSSATASSAAAMAASSTAERNPSAVLASASGSMQPSVDSRADHANDLAQQARAAARAEQRTGPRARGRSARPRIGGTTPSRRRYGTERFRKSCSFEHADVLSVDGMALSMSKRAGLP